MLRIVASAKKIARVCKVASDWKVAEIDCQRSWNSISGKQWWSIRDFQVCLVRFFSGRQSTGLNQTESNWPIILQSSDQLTHLDSFCSTFSWQFLLKIFFLFITSMALSQWHRAKWFLTSRWLKRNKPFGQRLFLKRLSCWAWKRNRECRMEARYLPF